VHLAYLDESHDKSEYRIAGFSVPALRAQALEFALDAVTDLSRHSRVELERVEREPVSACLAKQKQVDDGS